MKVFGDQTKKDILPGQNVPHFTGKMVILISKIIKSISVNNFFSEDFTHHCHQLLVALQGTKKLKTSLYINQKSFTEMVLNVSMTPGVTKVDCNVPKCNKTLKNQKNLNSHMEKVHKVVLSITQSPLANTVRTLFSGEKEAQPSTQGTSSGAVNSPKVRSEGYFHCNVCELKFPARNDLTEQMKVHDNADDAEDDEEDEHELITIAEDMECELVAKQVENLVLVDKIVNFVENAFKAMNPNEENDKVEFIIVFARKK